MKDVFKKYLKNKFFILSFLILVSVSFSFFLFMQYKERIPLIILADIHAGSQEERIDSLDPNNIIYPINFEKNLNSVLSKADPEETIIALGDNLNQKSEKYAMELKNIMLGREVIWVKGNHDKEEIFTNLFNKNTYYSIEKDKWKIIVIDNGTYNKGSENGSNNRGKISNDQINWLREQLKTNKKILIAMHVPIFDEKNPNVIREDQKFLHEIFRESKRVKYVLAGHFHSVYLEKKINGIKYIVVPALSKKDQEGFFIRLKI